MIWFTSWLSKIMFHTNLTAHLPPPSCNSSRESIPNVFPYWINPAIVSRCSIKGSAGVLEGCPSTHGVNCLFSLHPVVAEKMEQYMMQNNIRLAEALAVPQCARRSSHKIETGPCTSHVSPPPLPQPHGPDQCTQKFKPRGTTWLLFPGNGIL